MPRSVVEYDLPGTTLAQLAAIRRAAHQMCATFAREGKPVQYLRSTFVPGESRCLCLFEAPDADLVQEINEDAQIPYTRIILAVDLPPMQQVAPTRGARTSSMQVTDTFRVRDRSTNTAHSEGRASNLKKGRTRCDDSCSPCHPYWAGVRGSLPKTEGGTRCPTSDG